MYWSAAYRWTLRSSNWTLRVLLDFNRRRSRNGVAWRNRGSSSTTILLYDSKENAMCFFLDLQESDCALPPCIISLLRWVFGRFVLALLGLNAECLRMLKPCGPCCP